MPESLRFQIGDNLVVCTPCSGSEAGAGPIRSGFAVFLNDIHRAYLTFPSGYGGRWTLTGRRDIWNLVPKERLKGDYHRAVQTHAHRAAVAGKAGQRQVLDYLFSQPEHYLTPIEVRSRVEAWRDHESSRDREYAAQRAANDIKRMWAKIARRREAEEHLEALRDIDTTTMGNRSAVAIGLAMKHAAEAVEEIARTGEYARKERERADRLKDRRRSALLNRERGQNYDPRDILPDWCELTEDDFA